MGKDAKPSGTDTNLHGGEGAAPVFGIGKVTSHAPVEVIEVVRTELTKVGDGTAGNPYRKLVEYWTPEGDLIAIVDPADDVEIAPSTTEHDDMSLPDGCLPTCDWRGGPIHDRDCPNA